MRRPRPALRDVQDGVEILLASLALDDAPGHLVDPPGRLAARRALAAALVGVEARDDMSASGMDAVSSITMMPAEPIMEPLLLGPSTSIGMSISSGGQDGRRRAARHDPLELFAPADAAAVIVDQLRAASPTPGASTTPGFSTWPDDGVETRAALALGAEAREPLRARLMMWGTAMIVSTLLTMVGWPNAP